MKTTKFALIGIVTGVLLTGIGLFISLDNTEEVTAKNNIEKAISYGWGVSPLGTWAFQDYDGHWYTEPGGDLII